MDVRNCKRCRKIFNYIGGQPLCPQCKEELEKKFQEVKAFVQEHKNISVAEVAKECEVEESQIHQWVKEERLMFSSGINIGIVCEKCGEPIETGRFCGRCKVNMINDLSEAGRRPAPEPAKPAAPAKEKDRMRFLNT